MESAGLIEDSSGLYAVLAEIVQGSYDPYASEIICFSYTIFMYAVYAVWSTRELILLLPDAVEEEKSMHHVLKIIRERFL
jgi:hypothetical protein